MASFLAAFKAATAKPQPVPEAVSEPVGVDARALQAKLTAALGDVGQSPDPDAELLTLHARYREARKEMHKVFAERVSSDAEADLILGRCNAILRDIARMRAQTPRGLGAKLDVLRNCECSALEKICPQESDAVLLQSIVADSYWLFGAGAGMVSEERERNEAKADGSSESRARRNGRPAMSGRP
jgi:hypothetical protein